MFSEARCSLVLLDAKEFTHSGKDSRRTKDVIGFRALRFRSLGRIHICSYWLKANRAGEHFANVGIRLE